MAIPDPIKINHHWRWQPMLMLVLLIFYLGHISQHDMPDVSHPESTECEFCLKGHNPHSLYPTSVQNFNNNGYVWQTTQNIARFVAAYPGFSFISRAPPLA